MIEERKAFHKKQTQHDEQMFISSYNHVIKEEAKIKALQYEFQRKEQKFENILTANNAIARKSEETFIVDSIM